MATRKKAPAYEPETEYQVTLARPVTVYGQQFLPLHQHTIRGDTLTLIVQENGADVVAAAAPVTH